ncbi:MAG: ATP-binding cassette domain-containing protein [Prevotellaceae bacterium]|jgi:cell division transport system ATP-binding protein|nr:ATP-binding cassette domain-containing protein [Prevotellaceae bacterium]
MEKDLLIRYKDVEIRQQEHLVLEGVNWEVRPGDFFYLIGRVGSGKTSLLKTLYAELDIAAGEAGVLDYDLRALRRWRIPQLRRRLGIVFQDFQLLTDRTVYENLWFVLQATGWRDKSKIEERIAEVLRQVGMENKGYKMPSELSGGEQQRIVIARATLNSPSLILADEPTGNLDAETGDAIARLLHSICRQGSAVVMSTHNLHLVQAYPGRVLRCSGHRLTDVTEEYHPELKETNQTNQEDNKP